MLDDAYQSQTQVRKIDFINWNQFKKLIYLHLYSSSRTVDTSKANVICRLLNEKEEKGEKGWLIESVELKNCKFDQGKGCLEVNDRNDNRKIQNILVTLCDKDLGLGFTLPLTLRGE